ncbi:hypothetical protein AOQ73_26810 [Bradyrhizobium pachyrhizi]|nr:hypothetical protein AOQ73_26810 [Bradyrhizobium pachyrhizi]
MEAVKSNWGSLQAVEDLTGCDFDLTEAEKLAGAPEDQLGFFLSKFAPSWYDWLDNEGIAARTIADKPLYLPSGPDYSDGKSAVLMSSASYKRAALCFTTIAVPDPLASALHAAVEGANMLGTFPIEKTQAAFRAGLLRLAEIAPLVRAGAFTLMPNAFAGLHPTLQEHAREELRNFSFEDLEFWTKLVQDADPGATDEVIRFGVRYLTDEFALALAWVATTGAWPITATPHVFERIEEGLSQTAKKGKGIGLEVARAIATFQLPDASGVDWSLLAKIRTDDPRFAEFRTNLDLAVVEASRNAGESPELFAAFLKDLLQKSAEQCRKAGGFSSSLDGVLAPTLASLSIAAAKVNIEGISIADVGKVAVAAAEIVSPGAAWLVLQAIASLSPKAAGERRIARLYGSLAQSL